MNRERLERLRATAFWLHEQPRLPADLGFHMNRWHSQERCQTLMCLAGWYVYRNSDCGLEFQMGVIVPAGWTPDVYLPNSMEVLAEHFDIGRMRAEQLFHSRHYSHTVRVSDRRGVTDLAIRKINQLLAGETYGSIA